ncbi:hypothetical protein [Paraburkholderia sp. BR13444]|uniref:hypothetical protein n=1 Tax=Paraburkholderia sp. BR13444 TaxID=3236997 RepID=UPI0034CFC436
MATAKARATLLASTIVEGRSLDTVSRRILAHEGAGEHVGLMSDLEVARAMAGLAVRHAAARSRVVSAAIIREAGRPLDDATARVLVELDGGVGVLLPRGIAGSSATAKVGTTAKPPRKRPGKGSVVFK